MNIRTINTLVKWTTVRGFGTVKYFNISYVVLFIVPVVHELYLRAVPAMAWLGAPQPFPYTLRWLYGASLLYALGIAAYQYFCPADIKRFGNSDEYVQANHNMYGRALPQHRLGIVIANLDPLLDAETLKTIEDLSSAIERSAGDERNQLEQQLDQFLTALHPDAVQRFLLNDYGRKNLAKPAARWLSFILYVAGTLDVLWLLAVRSYDVFTR